MSRHQEPLNGGVVSSRDPSLLDAGQLAAARNCLYLPHSPALQRMRGRTAFGTVSATAVDIAGLRDLQFDNADQFLIAHASASYLSAVVGDTGTFGLLASGLPGVGSGLEIVQYRNRYFLMNGTTTGASSIGSNRVVYLSATAASQTPLIRQHGMLPMQAMPQTTAVASAFSQSVTGYYEYWTTEVAKIQQDATQIVLEGTFLGSAATVLVSSTGMAPQIGLPTIQNAIATHWRIYRSPVKAAASDKKFPSGFMIAELATAVTAALDSSVTASTGLILPGNVNGVGDGATVYAGWSQAARLSAADGSYASAQPLSTGLFTNLVQQGVYGFNFGGFTGNVRGIEVEIKAYASVTGYPVDVIIGRKRKSNGGFASGGSAGVFDLLNNTATRSTIISATASGSAQTVTLGAPTDRWLAADNPNPFSSTDFGTDFMAVLSVSKAGVINVDYVKVNVYYAATFDSVVQFPTVVYTFGDITSQVGKRGAPPSSTTGDLFEGSLVVNDVDNPRLIRYSFPDEPESFPSTYFVPFETNENDRVRLIKVVNGRLVVGLDSSLWRVNFLPNERDAQFDRGKSREAISRTYGVVNAMCACVYSTDGPADRLAVVSDQGIFDTDGYDFREITDSQDWRGTIATLDGTYTPIALVNDRERRQLLYYFQNTDDYGNETYLCLPLCYSAEQLVNGKPKVGGVLHMRNYNVANGTRGDLKSAWCLPRTTGEWQVYLGYGGTATAAGAGVVYRENGTAVPAEDTTMRFVTRRMYLAGFSNEWELADLYGHATYAGSPSVTYFFSGNKTNDAGPAQVGSKSVTLGGQRLHMVSPRIGTEGLQVTAHVTAGSYAADFLVLDGNWPGGQDSGR